jgi:hypothetical protein
MRGIRNWRTGAPKVSKTAKTNAVPHDPQVGLTTPCTAHSSAHALHIMAALQLLTKLQITRPVHTPSSDKAVECHMAAQAGGMQHISCKSRSPAALAAP